MVRTPKLAPLLAVLMLSLGTGLAACGDDDETATTPGVPAAPPIDIAKSVSESPQTAKVKLVVDILGDYDPANPGLDVRTRADFTISSAVANTPAEGDAALYKGIDLLQQDDAKLTQGLVPLEAKTKYVQQTASGATSLTKKAFLASIKGGPLPVVISWPASARGAKSTKALLRRTPIEVRTIPLKGAAPSTTPAAG